MERKKIVIGHLFPDMLNMYGDKGNILALKNRLLRRDIDAHVIEHNQLETIDFKSLDIVLLGGGSDREQRMVCRQLRSAREAICDYVESGGVLLALCGGYPLLGTYYKQKDEIIEGLSILDIHTEWGEERLIGDVIISSNVTGKENLFVGFENHSGRTYIGNHKPFGTVRYGHGNNGEDSTCGVVYKNLLGTYLHGPLLPKNPVLTDELLTRALLRKYGERPALSNLDDKVETEAHDYIVNRFLKQ